MKFVLVLQDKCIENQSDFVPKGSIELNLERYPPHTKLPNIKGRQAYYVWPVLANSLPQKLYHISNFSQSPNSLTLGLGNSYVITKSPEIVFPSVPWTYLPIKDLGYTTVDPSTLIKIGS